MDAFAVAVGIGLASHAARGASETACEEKTPSRKFSFARKFDSAIIAGLYFGFFQGAMPLIGFFSASHFTKYVSAYSHFIAFALLFFLGGKMIFASFEKNSDTQEFSTSPRQMLPLALATSIDALAIGVLFAFQEANIFYAICVISLVTFLFSFAGVKIGGVFGEKYKSKATFAGGAILVIIGIRIFLGGI